MTKKYLKRIDERAKQKKVVCVINDDVVNEIRKIYPEFSHEHIRGFVRSFTGGQSKFFNGNLLKEIKKANKAGKLTKEVINDYIK